VLGRCGISVAVRSDQPRRNEDDVKTRHGGISRDMLATTHHALKVSSEKFYDHPVEDLNFMALLCIATQTCKSNSAIFLGVTQRWPRQAEIDAEPCLPTF